MTIKESGFCYPNKMGRIFVMSVEETMGQEATKTIFNLAGIPVEYYPPPNNFAKEFDFAYYGAIGATLEKCMVTTPSAVWGCMLAELLLPKD